MHQKNYIITSLLLCFFFSTLFAQQYSMGYAYPRDAYSEISIAGFGYARMDIQLTQVGSDYYISDVETSKLFLPSYQGYRTYYVDGHDVGPFLTNYKVFPGKAYVVTFYMNQTGADCGAGWQYCDPILLTKSVWVNGNDEDVTWFNQNVSTYVNSVGDSTCAECYVSRWLDIAPNFSLPGGKVFAGGFMQAGRTPAEYFSKGYTNFNDISISGAFCGPNITSMSTAFGTQNLLSGANYDNYIEGGCGASNLNSNTYGYGYNNVAANRGFTMLDDTYGNCGYQLNTYERKVNAYDFVRGMRDGANNAGNGTRVTFGYGGMYQGNPFFQQPLSYILNVYATTNPSTPYPVGMNDYYHMIEPYNTSSPYYQVRPNDPAHFHLIKTYQTGISHNAIFLSHNIMKTQVAKQLVGNSKPLYWFSFEPVETFLSDLRDNSTKGMNFQKTTFDLHYPNIDGLLTARNWAATKPAFLLEAESIFSMLLADGIMIWDTDNGPGVADDRNMAFRRTGQVGNQYIYNIAGVTDIKTFDSRNGQCYVPTSVDVNCDNYHPLCQNTLSVNKMRTTDYYMLGAYKISTIKDLLESGGIVKQVDYNENAARIAVPEPKMPYIDQANKPIIFSVFNPSNPDCFAIVAIDPWQSPDQQKTITVNTDDVNAALMPNRDFSFTLTGKTPRVLRFCTTILDANTLTLTLNLESENCTHKLNWKYKAQDVANREMIIEKSTDGINYQVVQQILPLGQSTNELFYQFQTASSASATYFRVSAQGADGTTIHSNTVHAQSDCGASFSLYPNPAHDKLYLRYKQAEEEISFILYSPEGKNIKEEKWTSPSADFEAEISLKNLSPGVYSCKIQSGEVVSTQKIIVQ